MKTLCYVAAVSVCLCSIDKVAHATDYYVATTGSDANPGTLVSPFLTIQKACNEITSGDRVLIRGGTYREQFQLVLGHLGTAMSPITIEGYTNETVVIKASEVITDWDIHDAGNNIWKKTNWIVNSQQVFVHSSAQFDALDDGIPLAQIGMPNNLISDTVNGQPEYFFTVPFHSELPLGMGPNVQAVASYWADGSLQGTNYYVPETDALAYMATNAGTFYFSASNSTLYVRLPDNGNPNNKGMEASIRFTTLSVTTTDPEGRVAADCHAIFRNLNFRHSNAAAVGNTWYLGAGNFCTYENLDIEWMDLGALGLHHSSKALNCNLSNNGNSGGYASGSTNILFTGCSVLTNNYRRFRDSWHSGGFKIIPNVEGTIENCEVAWNIVSPGIWIDYCRSNRVVVKNNYIHNNGRSGIALEASRNVDVLNNIVNSNLMVGIAVAWTDDSLICNNTLVGNSQTEYNAAISVWATTRTNLYGGWLTATNNRVFNNILFENQLDLDIAVNSNAYCYSNYIDFNCYYRASNESSFQFTGVVNFAGWQSQYGFDTHGLYINPQFAIGAGSDWALACNSPLIDRGTNHSSVTNDYAGTTRPLQNAHDIGAYENTGLKKGDFNLDGFVDIVWRKGGTNRIWHMPLLSESMSGTQYPLSTNTVSPNDPGVYSVFGTSDFNLDCMNDLLWRNGTNNVFWFMDGATQLSSASFRETATTWQPAGTGDLNGDGKQDIVWRHNNGTNNAVWFMDGTNFVSSAFLPDKSGSTWYVGGIGDFNSDGKDDILWRQNSTAALHVWYMNGSTTNAVDTFSGGAGWAVSGVGHFDANATPDILWRNGNANAVWLMNGTNMLKSLGIVSLDSTWTLVGPK